MDSLVAEHSRRTLLKVAALLHDIGKISTIQSAGRGATSCPEHATESLRIFESRRHFLPLTFREQAYVAQIIEKHHDIDRFICCQSPEHCAAGLERYRRENEHILIDLLLFYLSDVEGSRTSQAVKNQKPLIWKQISGIIFDALAHVHDT